MPFLFVLKYIVRKNLPLLLVNLLVASTIWAEPCDGLFRMIASKYHDGYEIKQAKACFRSGECVVLIDKYRQRAINHHRATAVLGKTGRVVENPDPAVNCHSRACTLAGVPLPKGAWLDDRKDYLVIQNEFFRNTGLRYNENNLSTFNYDPSLRTGDLVLMDGDGYIHHSGIIVKEGNFNWVRSKLDEDWVVDTPIENLWGPYQIRGIRVLRRK